MQEPVLTHGPLDQVSRVGGMLLYLLSHFAGLHLIFYAAFKDIILVRHVGACLLIPVLERQRKEDLCEYEASLVYRVRPSLSQKSNN